jgi:hypothetical protein
MMELVAWHVIGAVAVVMALVSLKLIFDAVLP